MELHAAEALLQLHCGPTRCSPQDIKLEIEGAATLFLSCMPVNMPTPETPSTATRPSPAKLRVDSARQGSVSSRDDNSETNSQSSFDSPVAYRGNKYHKSADKYRHLEPAYTRREVRQIKQEPNLNRAPQRNLFTGYGSIHQPIHLGQKKTCDQGTQTDDDELYRNTSSREIEKMDAIISQLYAKIRSLENQLNTRHRNTPTPSPIAGDLDPDVSTDVLKIQQFNQHNNHYNKRPLKRHSSSSNAAIPMAIDTDASDDDWKPEDRKPRRQMIHQMFRPKGNEMIPIGEGYATVPARLLKQIDWSSYTGATRKLLTAVFSRRVLATHSLTGKPSPAFPGKPAKKRLDPELVNDIVQIVVERCGVPESVVRTSITTKCADESKMYRARQKNKMKEESFKSNQENVPPSPAYGDDEFSDDTF